MRGAAITMMVAAVLFGIRFLGPSTLADGYHQERAAAYVLDVLEHGRWICQRGAYDEIMTKPPLFTWAGAIASLALGGTSWFALLLPGALATFGSALIILALGEKYFAPYTGLLASIIYLLSPVGWKQIALVRIDGLFTFTVALTALFAWKVWESRKGWLGFWLAAGAATLAKGPLGLVLGGLGLAAVLWEKRGTPQPVERKGFSSGVIIFLLITAGWLTAAYLDAGPAVLNSLIGRELAGQVVIGTEGKLPLQEFYLPTLYFLNRFAPWSLLTVYGLWRIYQRPSEEHSARRLERFLFCWFMGGLLIFSVAAHQRPDLIFPIVPPAALIAGREGMRLLRSASQRATALAFAAIIVFGLGAAGLKYLVFEREEKINVHTAAVSELASFIRTTVGADFPLTHFSDPFALQVMLGSKTPFATPEATVAALNNKAAAYVISRDTNLLIHPRGRSNGWQLVWQPKPRSRNAGPYLLSNRQRLEKVDHTAFATGPLLIEATDLSIRNVRGLKYELTARNENASLRVWDYSATNNSRPAAIILGDEKIPLGSGVALQRGIAGSKSMLIELPPP